MRESKIKAYWLIFFIALQANWAFANLSYDSLQRKCVLSYENDILHCDDKQLKKLAETKKIVVTTQEIFKSCFENTIIFIANYDFTEEVKCNMFFYHGSFYNTHPKLYAFDIHTGKEIIFKSEKSFFQFVNSSSVEITNLDKCYLYLFLNKKKSYGVMFRNRYYDSGITSNSEFIKNASVFFTFNLYIDYIRSFSHRLLVKKVYSSTKSDICIYFVHWEERKNKITNVEYVFSFSHNNLIGIKKTRYIKYLYKYQKYRTV